jgi:hypothetical protein
MKRKTKPKWKLNAVPTQREQICQALGLEGSNAESEALIAFPGNQLHCRQGDAREQLAHLVLRLRPAIQRRFLIACANVATKRDSPAHPS